MSKIELGIWALVFVSIAVAGCVQPPVACTADAKQCPDGSYVGRVGPSCEFAQCPAGVMGTLTGTVIIGPLCPVEPCNPPADPSRYYADMRVNIAWRDTGVLARTVNVDSAGHFAVQLGAGDYQLQVTNANGQPYGLPGSNPPKPFTITAGGTTVVNVDIDTGIR